MISLQERANKKVCFIAGVGHSGSTLLGFVLGSHSHCFYAGEAEKTGHLHNSQEPEEKRVCKICGADCPVWHDFVVCEGVDLYEQISTRTKKTIIVDSTKNTRWIRKQIDTLSNTTSELFVIFLQRDGRAVINSWIRKYPARGAGELIGNWARQVGWTQALFDRFDGKKIKVRYEELATEPERVTRELCAFLEIAYQPDMLSFYQHEHHPLGGNNGTQFLVAKAQGGGIKNPYALLSDRNRAYYRNHPLGIRLDMRWEQEIDPEVGRLFDKMAGQINAELEWGPDQREKD
jgi:hypothetical protein